MSKPNRPQRPPASAQKITNRPPLQQKRTTPVAPSVYRPQPPPVVLQPKAVAPQMRKPPAAPPVYRPQPAPKCLQLKAATQQQTSPGRTKAAPSPPPAYRPQPTPHVLQRKAATVQRSPAGATKPAPAAPPAYRPQSVPKVLQRKDSTAQSPPITPPAKSARPAAQGTPRPMRPPAVAPSRAAQSARPRQAGSSIQRLLSSTDAGKLGKYLKEHLPNPGEKSTVDKHTREYLLQEDLFIILGQKFNTYDEAVVAVDTEYNALKFQGKIDRKFAQAARGKQVANASSEFQGLKKTIEVLLDAQYPPKDFDQKKYRILIKDFTLNQLNSYTKLKDLVQSFRSISSQTLEKYSEIKDEIKDLFSWLIPLHDKTVKAVPDKDGIMRNITLMLESRFETLKELEGHTVLPTEAIIRHKPPKKITAQIGEFLLKTYDLGVQSEIVASRLGAKLSGEKAEGRTLESELSKARYPLRYVAGHLVADTIGGKFEDCNLTPITESFNTSKPGMKEPEDDARARLKAGKVIHYKATVTYGNESCGDYRAVLPTAIRIEISTMDLKEGGEPKNIRDYCVRKETKAYSLSP